MFVAIILVGVLALLWYAIVYAEKKLPMPMAWNIEASVRLAHNLPGNCCPPGADRASDSKVLTMWLIPFALIVSLLLHVEHPRTRERWSSNDPRWGG